MNIRRNDETEVTAFLCIYGDALVNALAKSIEHATGLKPQREGHGLQTVLVMSNTRKERVSAHVKSVLLSIVTEDPAASPLRLDPNLRDHGYFARKAGFCLALHAEMLKAVVESTTDEEAHEKVAQILERSKDTTIEVVFGREEGGKLKEIRLLHKKGEENGED